jgi:vacuolar-type H+-ATPase subunit C/Vma6
MIYLTADELACHNAHRTLTAHEISVEYRFLVDVANVLTARKSAISAEIHARLNSGEDIAGYKLIDGHTPRKLIADDDLIELLAGISPYKQVRKNITDLRAANMPASVIENITTRETMKVLVDDDDS